MQLPERAGGGAMSAGPGHLWNRWGLTLAALLALGFFGTGYVRARALAAIGLGGGWDAIAWLMLALAGVSLVLLFVALRRARRAADGGREA